MCIFSFPHLSSLLPFLKSIPKKTQQEQVTKKFSKGKQVYVGRCNPPKPAKQDANDTTTHSHHPYILCHFANYAPKKTFYMHLAYSCPLNKHSTQHRSLHSFPHKRQSISAMFSSNKISQHNLKLPTYDTDPVLLTVSAHKTELYLPCMPSSNYIAATHNVTHSPCTSTCTTHSPPSSAHN